MAQRQQRRRDQPKGVIAVKRKGTILLLVLTVATAAVGVTLAFMLRTAQAKNTFAPADVSCQVHEKLDGKEYTSGTNTGTIKTDITVKNTGNVPAFVRVYLVWNWTDGTNVAAAKSPSGTDVVLRSGWLKGSDGAYYYTQPVPPGELTTVLCGPITLTETTAANGDTVRQQLTVLAEAIQANPEKAVREAWGVAVTNGVITP